MHNLSEQHIVNPSDNGRPLSCAKRRIELRPLMLELFPGGGQIGGLWKWQPSGFARLHLENASAVRPAEQLGSEHGH